MILPDGQPLRWDMPGFVWGGNVPEHLHPPKNMSNNRISITQTEPQKQAVRDAIAALKVLLAWRISLGGDRKFAQLGEKGIPWDLKLREYEPIHAAHVPGYVDRPELARDREGFDFASEVERLLEPLLEDIKDTRAALSNDIYMADLKIYHAFEGAAAAGAPGMDTVFNDLQERFPKAYSRNPRPPQTP